MEIVLNFEKKELVIKQAANIRALYKRLKVLLGKDLKNWTAVSENTYLTTDWWYYRPYPTYPWPYTMPYITYGTGDHISQPDTTIYCLSDQPEQAQGAAQFKIDGQDLMTIVERRDHNDYKLFTEEQ